MVFSATAAAQQTTLAPVVIQASPLASELFEYVTPATVVEGARLREQRGTTLGESIGNEPGVSSTYFGPNASRPVIRGLDGDRIRILQNGVGTIDASATSADHAVSIDPLVIERVEVLRGPAALMYGGTAVGGVVNVIDARIPQEPLQGVQGAVDARYGTAARENAQGARIDAGNGGFVMHADVFRRRTADLKIPDFARSRRLREQDPLPADEEPRGRLPNSASETEGGAVGGSAIWNKGYIGASVSQYNSRYGTVAEPDVRIGLQQRRYELAGEVRDPGPAIRAIRWKAGYSDYQHIEYEQTDPGTTFLTRGTDARLELLHNPLAWMGGARGSVGLQVQSFKFSALGEEAFLPNTRTESTGLFVYEERAYGALKLSGGARIDSARVSAASDARFGDGEKKSFAPRSASLGALWSLTNAYALAVNTSYTERAPTYQELFANGPHIATDAFELGERGLQPERSRGVDVAFRKRTGSLTGSIGAFYNRFSNYVALVGTGVDDVGSGLPIFAYQPVKAEFKGLEAEGAWRAWELGGDRLTLELRGDLTRATNESAGTPLPRIAPLRAGGAIAFQSGRFGARLDAMRYAAQNRVAPNELPTDGFTLVNATVSYRTRLGRTEWEAFLRGVNLLDAEARMHTSFLKDKAPLAGRGAIGGMRVAF